MKYEVELNGERRTVELQQNADGLIRALVNDRLIDCQVAQPAPNTYLFFYQNQVLEFQVFGHGQAAFQVQAAGTTLQATLFDPKHRARVSGAETEGQQQITAPMPGKIVRLNVAPNDEVELGQGLIVIEAMKMQNELKSPKTGRVSEIRVSEGETVAPAQVLLVIE